MLILHPMTQWIPNDELHRSVFDNSCTPYPSGTNASYSVVLKVLNTPSKLHLGAREHDEDISASLGELGHLVGGVSTGSWWTGHEYGGQEISIMDGEEAWWTAQGTSMVDRIGAWRTGQWT